MDDVVAAAVVAAAVTGGRLGDIALGGPAASDGGSYKSGYTIP
jgi:hypothetical protein